MKEWISTQMRNLWSFCEGSTLIHVPNRGLINVTSRRWSGDTSTFQNRHQKTDHAQAFRVEASTPKMGGVPRAKQLSLQRSNSHGTAGRTILPLRLYHRSDKRSLLRLWLPLLGGQCYTRCAGHRGGPLHICYVEPVQDQFQWSGHLAACDERRSRRYRAADWGANRGR